MTAKSVLMRTQGLRAGERAPTCPPSCYATAPAQHFSKWLSGMFFNKVINKFQKRYDKVSSHRRR